MPRKAPCRSCGRTLLCGPGSRPEPMCNPCRRINPQRSINRPSTYMPTVKPACADCGRQIVYALTDTPRCRPCRRVRYAHLKAEQRQQNRVVPSTADQRRARAASKLDRSARGTKGTATRAAGPCIWCGTHFIAMKNPAQFCSQRCNRKHANRKRVRAMAGGTAWTWSDFMRMASNYNYCCAYCGTKPDRLDPDHVVPLARGGDDSLSNLLPTCLLCNSDKRDLTLDEWHDDRARRGKPPRTTHTDHPHLALRPANPRQNAA